MLHYFEQIGTSEQVGVKKPNPEIFRHALVKAFCKPDESIMIGDDLPVDILGAKAMGMHQVYFNPEKTVSWIKKLTAIPFRTLETMAISVALTALIIALLTPNWLILNGAEIDMGYFGYHRLAWFLYAFIMLCSLSTFICFSQSIYPSEYQWNKKTYN